MQTDVFDRPAIRLEIHRENGGGGWWVWRRGPAGDYGEHTNVKPALDVRLRRFGTLNAAIGAYPGAVVEPEPAPPLFQPLLPGDYDRARALRILKGGTHD